MAQWLALGLPVALLSSAIVLCCRRSSPRHEFIVGAVDHLAQRVAGEREAEMAASDAQFSPTSAARRTA
jgi:hypothetical protein